MNFDRSLDVPYGVEMRLSPIVSRILAQNPGPFTFKGTGTYLVGAGKDVAVIDPGPDDPAHVAAILKANPTLKDPNSIRVGQELIIPAVESVPDLSISPAP